MLSGFYNENQERYLETLEFLVKLQNYVASGTVSGISMGIPLFINEHMALYHSADELGIVVDPHDNQNWSIVGDASNTLVERFYRRLVVQLVLDKLGIPMNGNTILNMFQMKSYLTKMKEKLTNE